MPVLSTGGTSQPVLLSPSMSECYECFTLQRGEQDVGDDVLEKHQQ